MIIKSSQRANHYQLASHLKSDENERAYVVETNGIYSSDIDSAMTEMKAGAAGSRAKKDLYHVSISPEKGKKLTDHDWTTAWKLHDKVHSLEGLRYIEIEHQKNGRTHRHRVYSRIDPETGNARNIAWSKIKNERVARQLEVQLGHEVTPGKHNRAVIAALIREGFTKVAEKIKRLIHSKPAVPAYTHNEWQLVRRGTPIDLVRAALADSWEHADSPEAFTRSLLNKGFVVAQGDKVPLAVSLDGDQTPLLRAINAGRKKAGKAPIKKHHLAEKLPEKLLTVKEAQGAQAERIHLDLPATTSERPKAARETVKLPLRRQQPPLQTTPRNGSRLG